MTAEQIAHALPKCRKAGKGWVVCCPGHEDNNPSLSISEENGTLLVHCHGPCDQGAVVEALKGLGLWPEGGQQPDHDIEAVYNYTDEDGALLYQIVR
ncbi:MAG: CHC2 zinc finger domain-containing protein, partial [Acidobacteriota bacterium]|nr:CHC2 zinc finger domain-containing protein [Acidobacteriota bacterium]